MKLSLSMAKVLAKDRLCSPVGLEGLEMFKSSRSARFLNSSLLFLCSRLSTFHPPTVAPTKPSVPKK